ncbi:protein TRM32-like [Durio zibethinus]|uniref:Protein TRM32-like n=1 Tax=Durio zibethinus TaxID=66656 RepID=A0A6P5ZMI0_DURZI|nr:protein TRM32-like [Durio zibethinus]
MNPFKDIKLRIKQALKERRKSISHTMVDGLTLQVSLRDTLSSNDREVSEKTTMEQDTINNFNSSLQINASDNDTRNCRLKRIRRTMSTNESLDRYTQLRISSLSDLESFCFLLDEVSRDALSSEMPISSILDYDANKESDAHNEPKSISFPEDIDKFEQVEAVLGADLQEKLTDGKPCDSNEDTKIDPCILLEEWLLIVLAKLRTFLKDRINHESVEYEIMGISSRFLIFESDKNAVPCYNYVRDILELSGFIQNEYLQTWYSTDQPLNPSLFKELETFLHPELESWNQL